MVYIKFKIKCKNEIKLKQKNSCNGVKKTVLKCKYYKK